MRSISLLFGHNTTTAKLDLSSRAFYNGTSIVDHTMSDKKIAIVTGGNRGLGFEIVKGLCKEFKGFVLLTSRNKSRGEIACQELRKLSYTPQYQQLDVTDNDSILNFCSLFKSKKIDLLVNNAGILFLKDAKESMQYQAEQTLFVNFFAVVNFTEAILPFINDNGTILNISSSSGHLSRIPSDKLKKEISDPNLTLDGLKSLMQSYIESVRLNNHIVDGWGDSPYVVSKVGLNAYTFMLNRRLKERGILVNCIHPGYVMTDMTRGAGNVSPEDAAKVVLKIALSTKTGGLYVWSNGETVPWDGPDPRGYLDGKSV